MADNENREDNLLAHCIEDCGATCALKPVRDGLGLAALQIDDSEPVEGPLTEKIRIVHQALSAVCLQHSMNTELYEPSPED